MTITAQDARDEYTATAGQTIFNYTFKIYADTELDVYITPSGQEADDSADLTTAYTVDPSTIGDPDGGFITLDSGANSGDLVTIVSSMPYNRTVDYQNSGDFLPDTVNGDNDRQVSQIKQVADLAGRSPKYPNSLQNAVEQTIDNPSPLKFWRDKSDGTGVEKVDLTTTGSPTDSSVITYDAGNNFPGGVVRSQENKNNDFVSLLDYGATGDGVTDDTLAIQAAVSSRKHIYAPPGLYRFTDEIVFSDQSSLHGSAMYSGVRYSTGGFYDPLVHTVFLYDGAGGTDSCGFRLSETPVGVEKGDLTPPDTDDLSAVQVSNFTVDGNGKAEYGIYCYRLVDNNIGPAIAAMRCKEAGIVILGSFINTFDNLTCFGNEKTGLVVGKNLFPTWSENEKQVNDLIFNRPNARLNGTAKTYTSTTNSDEGHGIYWELGRGNVVIGSNTARNDGAGMYFFASPHNPGGPNKILSGYTESNMADVVADGRAAHAYNIVVAYRETMTNMEFDGFYLSNSNSQDLRIVSQGDIPPDVDSFLTFKNCFFRKEGQLEIECDTSAYRIEHCSPPPLYTDVRPNTEEVSADGALDLISNNVEITTSTEQVDLTLPIGGPDGFEKFLWFKEDGGFNAVITPAVLDGYTTITLPEQRG